MKSPTENPFQPPQTETAAPRPSALPAPFDWKSVLRRWELLRLPYNLIVGVTGLLGLATVPPPFLLAGLVGADVYGLMANVMYLLGPVTELYLNWFVDAWEGWLVPGWAARFARSCYLTALLFVGGLLFSVGLTLAILLFEMALSPFRGL